MSLTETVRIRNGTAPLWAYHLRRLEASCLALGIPTPAGLIPPANGADRLVRFEIDQHGVTVTEREVGSTAPVRLLTSPVVHHPYRHKTTEREQFDAALAQARAAGGDEALLLTVDGMVAEASAWGVFWWERDRVCAPALALGVLPAVSRKRLAELAGGVVERRVGPSEIREAGLFLANAGRGVIEVAVWDGKPVRTHPGTVRLSEAFWP